MNPVQYWIQCCQVYHFHAHLPFFQIIDYTSRRKNDNSQSVEKLQIVHLKSRNLRTIGAFNVRRTGIFY